MIVLVKRESCRTGEKKGFLEGKELKIPSREKKGGQPLRIIRNRVKDGTPGGGGNGGR